jgi:anti-sigma factor RsiW
MSDQDNILPFGPGDGKGAKLSEDKLMAYLEGKLSPAEQHEVEQWMADEGMEGDALEGLQALPPEETKRSVARLNHNLRQTLLHKKRRRKPLKTDQLAIIAVAVVLILIVVAYIVIRKCF